MVEITTKEESDLIYKNYDILGIIDSYWLGLTKTGSGWKWEIEGEANFTSWYPGPLYPAEPDGSCYLGPPCNCASIQVRDILLWWTAMDWYDSCCDTPVMIHDCAHPVLCEANPIKSP